jgi:hypothetical protein
MAEETDGIAELFEGQLRVAVTAAGQVGERLARLREDALRRAQATSEREARELRSRFEAEQRAARAEYAGAYRSEWWDRATPEQIGHAFETARAWSHEDPEASRAEERMRDELRTRYGVDAANTGADAGAVRAAVERSERERGMGDVERQQAAVERAEAQQLLAFAAEEDRLAEEDRAAAEHEPDPNERERAHEEATQREHTAAAPREDGADLYDTAERRSSTAADMEAKGIDREVVATRMRADVSQAKPASEAAKSAARSKAPKARTNRSRSARVQRTGLDR